jgi:hypothetical protein
LEDAAFYRIDRGDGAGPGVVWSKGPAGTNVIGQPGMTFQALSDW